MTEKSDILTPWKETDRRRREVYTESGIPDGALRRGMYHRVWNSRHPHLNSVEGKSSVPGGRLGGLSVLNVDRPADQVCVGDVYDLRIRWGNQQRIKCPGCSKYKTPDLEIECRCGTVLSQMPEDGHYQIARLP